jgi:hypothetical protein
VFRDVSFNALHIAAGARHNETEGRSAPLARTPIDVVSRIPTVL